jgi:acyl-CoA reductase-like NAD-dependent aldehyde dehydrogenase
VRHPCSAPSVPPVSVAPRRRLIAHESVKEEIVTRLKAAYSKVRIGPLEAI